MTSRDDILNFWFVEHGEPDWFGGKPEFDALLAERFGETYAAVARGEAAWWRASPSGRLAEIIVLDQFCRQLHRKRPEAFASDAMALRLAQEAVALGDDMRVEPRRRTFFYMPYMHSEDLAVHDEAIRLFTALGDEDTLKYEIMHRDCIARFGRYPRRNAALGRVSTPDEIAYINSGDGMF
ncbi:DUF924 domain-containing protein [Devosia sp. LjRoot16]|uniref:DUF924 family protein n=1 Tax=Devosia sp. LjRoot16 TaxID=3342271 RepID=UPI003ECC924C